MTNDGILSNFICLKIRFRETDYIIYFFLQSAIQNRGAGYWIKKGIGFKAFGIRLTEAASSRGN
jgi:hypothetical protein